MSIMLCRLIVVAALCCSSLATPVNAAGNFPPNDTSISQVPEDSPTVVESSLWSDSGKRSTNAQRFRAGLNPLPPRRTRTSSALRARASPVSCSVYNKQGKIAAYGASDNIFRNYMTHMRDGEIGISGMNYTEVRLPDLVGENAQFEILALNTKNPAFAFVGALPVTSGYSFGAGSSNYALFVGTGHTDANSPPSYAGSVMQRSNYNPPVESTIWRIDCTTLVLTPQWINPDGSQPVITTFSNARAGTVGITGDLSKTGLSYAFAVTLKYVPNAA